MSLKEKNGERRGFNSGFNVCANCSLKQKRKRKKNSIEGKLLDYVCQDEVKLLRENNGRNLLSNNLTGVRYSDSDTYNHL